jgi:enterochelin esterase-like enzyme
MTAIFAAVVVYILCQAVRSYSRAKEILEPSASGHPSIMESKKGAKTLNDRRYYQRTVVKNTIDSEHLGEQRQIRIFLPPGYEEGTSYPVIYCQDGEQFFNFGRIATHTMKLILDERMPAPVIVGVDANLRERTEEYAPEGSRHLSYVSFFHEELVPYVERNYSVGKEGERRILAGDSLGGTVSLHLALSRPQRFRQVISLSGAFFETTLQSIRGAGHLGWLRMYMLVGTDEQEVRTDRGTRNFLQANREAKQVLEQQGARVRYLEKPGGHTWGFWQNELPEALRFVLRPN